MLKAQISLKNSYNIYFIIIIINLILLLLFIMCNLYLFKYLKILYNILYRALY